MTFSRSLVLAVLVTGCGDSDLEDLCDAGGGVWTLQQAISEKCQGNANPLFTSSYLERNCRSTFEPLFESGKVTLASEAVLDECRSALSANPCKSELYKDWVDATAICNDIIVGQTVTGGSCSVDDECGGESYCNRSGSCGLCVGKAGSGAACTGGEQCQTGICLSGMCQPNMVPENGQCLSDRQCGPGLICRDNGHCQPLEGHIGKACTRDGDCNAFQSSCSNGVCEELGKPGAMCTPWTGGDGTAPHCEWFSAAGCFDGKCEPLPVAVDGGACGIDVAQCAAGLWCGNNRCYPVTEEGGFCNGDLECGPYALCVEHACTFSDFNAACVAP